jgi:hypothetical protein
LKPLALAGRGQRTASSCVYPLVMPLPSPSPVPPADGVVTQERLEALLALGAEYDELDYKSKLELSSQRDEVELAKDVGAMQVKGGFIVVGVDGNGTPTGEMDGVATSPFDPARLVPKMQRYLAGPLLIASSVLEKDGHTIVLVCISPNPNGCAFFRIAGEYQVTRPDGSTETKTKFRADDMFWRESTSSVRITKEGLDEVIERRFSARRDDLLREWAAAQRAFDDIHGPQSTESRPAPTFAIPSDEVPDTAVKLIRDDDAVGVRQMLDDGRGRARAYIKDAAIGVDQLPTLLDAFTCVAATFLSYGKAEWFESVVDLLVDVYAVAGDGAVVERLGYSTRISGDEKAPRVWLAIIQRVFALGGLAVRRESWPSVRLLTTQLPPPLAQVGFEHNWLRHALTMASRASHFAPSTEPGQEIGLIDLARDDALRLPCLRSDGPSDDETLTSIAQFDVLANLVSIDDAQTHDLSVFYPNFARFRQERVEPIVERLIADPVMQSALLRGDSSDLAAALAVVGRQAEIEGQRYRGFHGWYGSVSQYVAQNLPPDL